MITVRMSALLCLICGGVFFSNAYLHFMMVSPLLPSVLFLALFLALLFVKRGDKTASPSKSVSAEESAKLSRQKAKEKTDETLAFLGVLAEYSFIVLPLIVVWMVGAVSGWEWRLTIGSPEFSFGAAILIGQSIIKIVGVTARGVIDHIYPIAFLVSFLIVFALVPSLIIMSAILTREHPSLALILAQLFLFALASLAFFVMGFAVNSLEISDKETIQKEREQARSQTFSQVIDADFKSN